MKSIVAINVKRIINERCLKQCAVATRAGYSKQQFNDMLNERKIIRDMDIPKIAIALGVDANELFKKTEDIYSAGTRVAGNKERLEVSE